jgi:hypothetical protein
VDALTKAYEYAAKYETAAITIYMLPGTHSLLRNSEAMYIPKARDNWSQTPVITIDAIEGTPVTLYYKARDKFKFMVGAGLTIRNIIFEAADSVIIKSKDTNGCLSNGAANCCTITGSTLGGDPACDFVKIP